MSIGNMKTNYCLEIRLSVNTLLRRCLQMSNKKGICIRCLFYHTGVERFELPSTVLETGALPLNYTPIFCFLVYLENHIYYYTSKLLLRQ